MQIKPCGEKFNLQMDLIPDHLLLTKFSTPSFCDTMINWALAKQLQEELSDSPLHYGIEVLISCSVVS